jgi:hypothetical protein
MRQTERNREREEREGKEIEGDGEGKWRESGVINVLTYRSSSCSATVGAVMEAASSAAERETNG